MSKKKADEAAPTTEPAAEAPAKKAKAVAAPLKKGTKVKWTTGSRAGIREYTGVVLAFVPKGTSAQGLSNAANKSLLDAGIDPSNGSNRDRYVVKVGTAAGVAPEKDTYAFCNAKSTEKV